MSCMWGVTHTFTRPDISWVRQRAVCVWWENWIRRCRVASEDRKGQECERGDKIDLGERVFFGSGPLTAPGLTGGCVQRSRMAALIKRRVTQSHCWHNIRREFWTSLLVWSVLYACNTCNVSPYVLQLVCHSSHTRKLCLLTWSHFDIGWLQNDR